jgi:prepilin-type N-terminal cleavage/methylation domain-containing protein
MKSALHPSADIPADNRGFTLIETLLALCVFSIGIMAVMTLTSHSMTAFTDSRNKCVEINRSSLNLETLKEVGYGNTTIFTGATAAPIGTDGANLSYQDTNNAVVMETKLIVMQNSEINHGTSPSGMYELYFTKPFIE